MKKEKVSELIHEELSYIYCHNCESKDDDCDDCNRQAMKWSVAKSTADDLADKILKEFKDGKDNSSN